MRKASSPASDMTYRGIVLEGTVLASDYSTQSTFLEEAGKELNGRHTEREKESRMVLKLFVSKAISQSMGGQ
jgi:hypothetical protein